jgi:hypothetical protein
MGRSSTQRFLSLAGSNGELQIPCIVPETAAINVFIFLIIYPVLFLGIHNICWPSCRRVLIFPKGNNVDYFSMYLDVADSANLPYGWSRYAQFSLAVVNQIPPNYMLRKGAVLLHAVLSIVSLL